MLISLSRYAACRNWPNTCKRLVNIDKLTTSCWPKHVEGKRERSRPVIEAVAKKLCTEAIEAEKRCWTDGQEESESGNVKIGASYDMGWQKRGKGHNSLTGDYIFMLTSD